MAKSKVPLVFMKTGVEGAEPLGFYQAVAQAYRADLHSTDAVRLELSDAGTINFSRGMTRAVREETERRTAASVSAGRNVVYDGFLNTFDRREDVRGLAAEHGGFAVSLTMIAPIPLINDRLAERFEADVLAIPRDLSPLEDRLQVVQSMALQLQRGEWAHRTPEEVGETIVLNGTRPVAELLGQVAVYVQNLDPGEAIS